MSFPPQSLLHDRSGMQHTNAYRTNTDRNRVCVCRFCRNCVLWCVYAEIYRIIVPCFRYNYKRKNQIHIFFTIYGYDTFQHPSAGRHFLFLRFGFGHAQHSSCFILTRMHSVPMQFTASHGTTMIFPCHISLTEQGGETHNAQIFPVQASNVISETQPSVSASQIRTTSFARSSEKDTAKKIPPFLLLYAANQKTSV